MILAPLVLGSTRPVFGLPAFWPVAVLLLLAAGLFAAARFGFGRERLRVPLAAPALAGLIAALAALQSTPLPRAAVGALSPERLRQDEAALEGLASPPTSLALSVAPDLTAAFAWKLAGYAVACVVAAALARRRRHARALLLALALTAGAEALFGTLAYFTRWSPFGFPDQGRANGTFYNPNNFAGFLELGFFASLGLFFDRIRRLRIPDYPTAGARISAAMDAPDFWRAMQLGGLTLVIGLGLLLSFSRGALFASIGGFLLFTVVMLRQRGRMLLIPALLTLVAAAFWAGVEPVESRLEQVFSEAGAFGRPQFWSMALAVFSAFPGVGAGLGAFRHSSIPHWPPEEASGFVLYAHNDYLDALAGGGIAGALLLVVMLAVTGALLWKRLKHPSPLLAGVAAALLALSAHAFVDFNWQIPGVAVAFFVMLGLAHSPAFRDRAATSRGLLVPPLLAFAAVVGFLVLPMKPRDLLAEARHAEADPTALLAEALVREPMRGLAQVELGWRASAKGDAAAADLWFRRARRREPGGIGVLDEARRYWLERIDSDRPDPAALDELAACTGPVLWCGARPADELLRETLERTRSADFLERLLPPVGHPSRPYWDGVIRRFIADHVR